MKKTLFSFLIMSFSIIVSAPISRAEPPSTIKYLMADPVSMLDYGIQKINDELQTNTNALKVGDETPCLRAAYRWESNRIRIEVSYIIDSMGSPVNKLSESCVKASIEKAIRHIKSKFLLVNPDTGAPMVIFGGDIPFSRFFEHQGYRNPLEPERLGFKLLQITELEVSFAQSDSGGSSIITGKCDALSTMKNISWSKR